jgi:hypothetical protein
MNFANVSLLGLTGCRIAGLDADTLTVSHKLVLSGSTFTAPLVLRRSTITGELNCNGARLKGASQDGMAMLAFSIRVGGDVFLGDGLTAAGAIDLRGADITGELNCNGAKVKGADQDGDALLCDGIKVGSFMHVGQGFTATTGAIRLPGADITGQLNCNGAKLKGTNQDGNALLCQNIRVHGDVFLGDGFTAAGTVNLAGADITGGFTCNSAKLKSPSKQGSALLCENIRVRGDAFLGGGFKAAGSINLAGAQITGTLNCNGARLKGASQDGTAMLAFSMKVGEDVHLSDGFTAAGAVNLARTDITGLLNCSGAQLKGADEDGDALFCKGIDLGGDMFVDEGFNCVGTVVLRSARIAGSLVLRPGALPGGDSVAIDATAAQIAHELRWAPETAVAGKVILEDVTVGQIDDSWTDSNGNALPNGYWPPADQGRLLLDGFTYARVGGERPATLAQRLGWIGSQPKDSAVRIGARFASQPYVQLAKLYQQAGQDAEARAVAIARRRDLRRYGDLTRSRKAANWLLDKTILYGYQTWRAVAAIIFLYVAVLLFLWIAKYHSAIVPVGDTEGLHPIPAATSCTSLYPCFDPFGYAIDTVIPLINVHQASFWGPNARVPWGTACVVVTYLATGLGWILATLALAGYTGLARRIDDL